MLGTFQVANAGIMGMDPTIDHTRMVADLYQWVYINVLTFCKINI